MSHKHESLSLSSFKKIGLHAERTEHCQCGAIRITKFQGNTPAQVGEWIFPEDPPPAAGGFQEPDAGRTRIGNTPGEYESSDLEGLENGLQKPSKLPYVAKHASVLHGSSNVATARSGAFAKRIAKALNLLQDSEEASNQE